MTRRDVDRTGSNPGPDGDADHVVGVAQRGPIAGVGAGLAGVPELGIKLTV